MLVDSHCHLNYKGLVEDQPAVLERARAAGVTGFLNISTRQSEWEAVVATARREPDVWATIGIHPHEADAHPDLGAQALLDGPLIPRSSASARPGSTTSTIIRTARRNARCSESISRRRAKPGYP